MVSNHDDIPRIMTDNASCTAAGRCSRATAREGSTRARLSFCVMNCRTANSTNTRSMTTSVFTIIKRPWLELRMLVPSSLHTWKSPVPMMPTMRGEPIRAHARNASRRSRSPGPFSTTREMRRAPPVHPAGRCRPPASRLIPAAPLRGRSGP